jgi:hypothetical protein
MVKILTQNAAQTVGNKTTATLPRQLPYYNAGDLTGMCFAAAIELAELNTSIMNYDVNIYRGDYELLGPMDPEAKKKALNNPEVKKYLEGENEIARYAIKNQVDGASTSPRNIFLSILPTYQVACINTNNVPYKVAYDVPFSIEKLLKDGWIRSHHPPVYIRYIVRSALKNSKAPEPWKPPLLPPEVTTEDKLEEYIKGEVETCQSFIQWLKSPLSGFKNITAEESAALPDKCINELPKLIRQNAGDLNTNKSPAQH